MSTARSSGSLASLARFGFTDLDGTIAKLDELVSLVGDSGRSALASLSKAANPDQALDFLIRISRDSKSAVKKLLSKEESALRLCTALDLFASLGSTAHLTDWVARENCARNI